MSVRIRLRQKKHLFLPYSVETKMILIHNTPAITLIPQLFSLPFFIASFLLGCQDLRGKNLRYLLIVSYFTTFIPQLISFFFISLHHHFISKNLTETTK
jgi:hypothetical protein